MRPDKYDFGGYATKNDVRCSDGRVIKQDAFKHQDGRTVPLVFMHGSNDPSHILGTALLENRPDGVYAYCTLNDSTNARNVGDLIKHAAINALSIHAGKLRQVGTDVLGGMIREVSTVLSGANPGALIDTLAFAHSEFDDGTDADEALIYTENEVQIELRHSDTPMVAEIAHEDAPTAVAEPAEAKVAEPAAEAAPEGDVTIADVMGTMDEAEKAASAKLIDAAMGVGEGLSAEDEAILDGMSTDKKAALGFLIDELDNDEATDESAEHSEMEIDMRSNVFDQNDTEVAGPQVLTHDDFLAVMELSKKTGSLKDAFMQHMDNEGYELTHAGTYGLDNIGVLFPDARSVTPTPEFVKRNTGWVAGVMSGTKHSPFAKIKSLSADITEDEARAKGYITGTEKANEVFALLSRSTEPTTVYKKQKIDRDDVLDITDFDVVLWLRAEMRMMLEEEIARAILIGDGRADADPYKVKADRIRPIYTDVALYATRVEVLTTDPNDQIDEVVRGMKNYKGTGSPTFYASPDVITNLILTKDTLGRRLYKTLDELAAGLRVANIVEVEVMTGVENATSNRPLFGIVVNLNDYMVGSDKGGDVNAFDDFDINFNQLHYLIETRISGALTKPKSAVIFELHAADEVG